MRLSPSLLTALAAVAAALFLCAAADAPAPVNPDAPRYDNDGRLMPPANYRDWVFLSSGVDMSYSEHRAMADAHVFDNVFAPPAAYAAFKRTGVWPDKTVLMLENRGAKSKGSINRLGLFQTGEITGLEAHVKDTARFKGGWGFFAIQGEASARQIPYTEACYSCHKAHGAADTTFVQFYPTLLPVATRLGTLNPAYVMEMKQGRQGNEPWENLSKRLPVDPFETIRFLNDTPRDKVSHLIFRNASCAVQKRCRRSEKMMSRIAAVVSSNIDTKVTATFSQSEASLGKVLNIFDALTNAPVALA